MTVEELISVLWKRRWTFLATFVATIAAVAAVTFSLPKVYSTVTYLLVDPKGEAGSDFEATQLSQILTRTFSELLQTRSVASDVAERLPSEADPDQVLASVDVAPVEDSQLLKITAEGSSPASAQALAQAYASTFIVRARDSSGVGGTDADVSLAEPAALVTEPTRPRPGLYLAIGTVLALFAGAAAALLRHRLDQRIEVDSTTREVFGLPVIGQVPKRPAAVLTAWMSPDRDEELASPGVASLKEAFSFVLANLAFANRGRPPATLAVVSAEEREGKSLCSLSVARTAMEQGMKAVLVDADLRRPSIATYLDLPEEETTTGLSSLLVVPGTIQRAATSVRMGYLDVVPAGPIPPNPPALLSQESLDGFNEQAKRRYDLVVYDTPPVSVGVDASLVAARVDGVLLVVDASKTRRSSLLGAIDQLGRVGANVLGVVLNKSIDARAYEYYGRDRESRRAPLMPAAAAREDGADGGRPS